MTPISKIITKFVLISLLLVAVQIWMSFQHVDSSYVNGNGFLLCGVLSLLSIAGILATFLDGVKLICEKRASSKGNTVKTLRDRKSKTTKYVLRSPLILAFVIIPVCSVFGSHMGQLIGVGIVVVAFAVLLCITIIDLFRNLILARSLKTRS